MGNPNPQRSGRLRTIHGRGRSDKFSYLFLEKRVQNLSIDSSDRANKRVSIPKRKRFVRIPVNALIRSSALCFWFSLGFPEQGKQPMPSLPQHRSSYSSTADKEGGGETERETHTQRWETPLQSRPCSVQNPFIWQRSAIFSNPRWLKIGFFFPVDFVKKRGIANLDDQHILLLVILRFDLPQPRDMYARGLSGKRAQQFFH